MMKWTGIVSYIISLFLLYVSTDIKVALTLASVILSVLYVWVVLLWMVSRKNAGGLSTTSKSLLLANLAVMSAVPVAGTAGGFAIGLVVGLCTNFRIGYALHNWLGWP